MAKMFIINLQETFYGQMHIEARNITAARQVARAMVDSNDVPSGTMNESGGYRITNIKEVPQTKPKPWPNITEVKND